MTEAESVTAAGNVEPPKALDAAQQQRLARAAELALRWHAAHHRKGTEIPYYSHLVQVEGLVLEHGGDVDQAVAALFHDALEDAESADERAEREVVIREGFGADVLQIVCDCTDTGADESLDEKKPWKERKTRYLAGLSAKSERSLLVVACDKRHNLHALVWDVRTVGPEYLEKFNAGPDEQVWYFESLLEGFRGRIPERLQGELTALVEDFRASVGVPA